MFKAVPKEWKKFDTNSEPMSEITWEETLCLEKYNDVMDRDKDCLLSKLVNYDQNSIKYRG